MNKYIAFEAAVDTGENTSLKTINVSESLIFKAVSKAISLNDHMDRTLDQVSEEALNLYANEIKPEGAPHVIVSKEDFPDSAYRSAWEIKDGEITINLDKAITLAEQRAKDKAIAKFKELDAIVSREQEELDKLITEKDGKSIIATDRQKDALAKKIELRERIDVSHPRWFDFTSAGSISDLELEEREAVHAT